MNASPALAWSPAGARLYTRRAWTSASGQIVGRSATTRGARRQGGPGRSVGAAHRCVPAARCAVSLLDGGVAPRPGSRGTRLTGGQQRGARWRASARARTCGFPHLVCDAGHWPTARASCDARPEGAHEPVDRTERRCDPPPWLRRGHALDRRPGHLRWLAPAGRDLSSPAAGPGADEEPFTGLAGFGAERALHLERAPERHRPVPGVAPAPPLPGMVAVDRRTGHPTLPAVPPLHFSRECGTSSIDAR